MTPATTEPKRITAGDTVAWTKSLADYPANAGWTLHYRLINSAGAIDLTGSASGSDHAITSDAATTETWPAGQYQWQAYVTKAAERYTVAVGQIVIAPNLAAASVGVDVRTNAQTILDNLLAAYATASSTHAYVWQYEVAGRMMRFNLKSDWLLEINFWRREVAREARALRSAAGEDLGNKTFVRF